MYRITCCCTYFHKSTHSIGVYLIWVILFGQIHDHLGEKHRNMVLSSLHQKPLIWVYIIL